MASDSESAVTDPPSARHLHGVNGTEATEAEMRVRRRLAADPVGQRLGIEVLAVEPGRVTLTISPDPGMLNGHAILHGGVSFTLGDTCFAYVCESLGVPSVTRHAEITYISPGDESTRLVARGEQRTRYGRNIVVDVALHDQRGRHMAEMRVFGVAREGR